jgi:succinate-semialdehyde dehydrogenase / glutarate-semialdehyde dehydrogenase
MQGPLIDAAALAKVEEHVADALSKGAKARYRRESLPLSAVTFMSPPFLVNVTPAMRINSEGNLWAGSAHHGF